MTQKPNVYELRYKPIYTPAYLLKERPPVVYEPPTLSYRTLVNSHTDENVGEGIPSKSVSKLLDEKINEHVRRDPQALINRVAQPYSSYITQYYAPYSKYLGSYYTSPRSFNSSYYYPYYSSTPLLYHPYTSSYYGYPRRTIMPVSQAFASTPTPAPSSHYNNPPTPCNTYPFVTSGSSLTKDHGSRLPSKHYVVSPYNASPYNLYTYPYSTLYGAWLNPSSGYPRALKHHRSVYDDYHYYKARSNRPTYPVNLTYGTYPSKSSSYHSDIPLTSHYYTSTAYDQTFPYSGIRKLAANYLY